MIVFFCITATLAAATHLTSSFPTSEPVTLTPVMGDEASTTEQHRSEVLTQAFKRTVASFTQSLYIFLCIILQIILTGNEKVQDGVELSNMFQGLRTEFT